MNTKILLITLGSLLVTGCASVPMESSDKSELAKSFNSPTGGNAGLYIYRSGSFGAALKKDVWIDGECIGETAPNMFFYEQVSGDKNHNISTESEFSPNDLLIKMEAGKNYFIRQYIKIGVFIGGAGLELIDKDKGQKVVSGLELAKKGTCSSTEK